MIIGSVNVVLIWEGCSDRRLRFLSRGIEGKEWGLNHLGIYVPILPCQLCYLL
jgi:hypothetical protein